MASLAADHCYLCHKPILPTYLSQANFGGSNVWSLERFLVFVTRYLNFNPGCSKPERTLNQAGLHLWKSWKNTSNFQICNVCVKTMESFCQYYDQWFSLQLEMNRCLEKVTAIFRDCENLKLKKQDAARVVGTETIEKNYATNIQDLEELQVFLNQVETHLRKTFPVINVTRIESTPSTSPSNPDKIHSVEVETERCYLQHRLKIERDEDAQEKPVDNDFEDLFADDFMEAMEPHNEDVGSGEDLFSENQNFTFAETLFGEDENQIDCSKVNIRSTQSANLIKSYKCLHCDRSFNKRARLERHERFHLFYQDGKQSAVFSCIFCEYRFMHWTKFEDHMRTHTREKPFNCGLCSKSFACPSSVRKHQRLHVGMKIIRRGIPYRPLLSTCLWCNKKFGSPSHLESHMRTHTHEKPLSCKSCQRSFACPSTLRKHARIHSDLKLSNEYQCSQCGMQFGLKESFVQHMRRHDAGSEKAHQCSECGKCFALKSYLMTHLRRHVSEAHRPEECSICHKRFTMKKDLALHMNKHTGDKPVKCRICGLGLSSWGARAVHEKRHRGDKPHKCKYCGRGFGTPRDRNRHEYARHEKEKVPKQVDTTDEKYQCRYCGKVFDYRKKLGSHERTHTRARPIQCPQCPKTFQSEKNLKGHLRKHVTQTAYKCDKCDESFAQKRLLGKHKRAAHGEETPFKCPLCLKTFAVENSVFKHAKRIHVVEWNLNRSIFAGESNFESSRDTEQHVVKEEAQPQPDPAGEGTVTSVAEEQNV